MKERVDEENDIKFDLIMSHGQEIIELKENQRIAIEAFEQIIALKDCSMRSLRSWNDSILIAEQALSTIRGK